MPGIVGIFSLHKFYTEGNELPHLVYVSREKRPGFEHHKKAAAMNSLVSLSPTTLMHFLSSSCFKFE